MNNSTNARGSTMAVTTRARIRLVVQINARTGQYRNAWFRVVSIHRKKTAAQKRAISARKAGCLARVRRFQGYWLVAVRKPRKVNPAWNHLICLN